MHPYIAVPAIFALVYRAWSRQSLTPAGILVAFLTAIIHAIHPWNLPFALLAVFFLAGTAVTKVKHSQKATLTLSSHGSSPSSPRTHVQVLCNSLPATLLIAYHTYLLHFHPSTPPSYLHLSPTSYRSSSEYCWPYGTDLVVVGIVAQYAAVAADTFSSELGILAREKPRLITNWRLREVPPGTNGGVTLTGTLAGFAGAGVIALTAVGLMPFCENGGRALEGGRGWGWQDKLAFVVAVTVWGGLGSVLDSVLGGLLQASVVDRTSGKVVEGRGGGRVMVGDKKDEGSRMVENGWGLLDNNGVNLSMAFIMTVGGMIVMSFVWDFSLT